VRRGLPQRSVVSAFSCSRMSGSCAVTQPQQIIMQNRRCLSLHSRCICSTCCSVCFMRYQHKQCRAVCHAYAAYSSCLQGH
jgi:hypothetical protein